MDAYGKQDLLDYLKRHDEGIPFEDAIRILRHNSISNKYRAISTMIANGQVIRRYKNGVGFLYPGTTLSVNIPRLTRNSNLTWPQVFAAVIKYGIQQPHLPARKRYMDALRHVMKHYEDQRVYLNLIHLILNHDLTHVDYVHIEAQLVNAGFNYTQTRDVYLTLPWMVNALQELGAEEMGISSEELERLKDWGDREELIIDYNENEIT